MKFFMMRKITAVLGLAPIFVAAASYADPIIDSCGFNEASQTASIQGSGFGTKNPAAPLLWDIFEDGTSGALLSSSGRWVPLGNVDGGTYNDSASYSGSLAAYNRVLGSGHPDYVRSTNFNTSNFFFSATDTIYYSYLYRFKNNDAEVGQAQLKFGRSNASPNTYNGAGNLFHSVGLLKKTDPSGAFQYSWGQETGQSSEANGHYHSGLQKGEWIRDELYKVNSTPGMADGMAFGYLGGSASEIIFKDVMTRGPGLSFQQTNILLGLMVANPGTEAEIEVWVDDVYVDNTQARIELCPGAIWTARGQCEIQIPKSWSDASVKVQFNRGRFKDGEIAYLYVIDKDGGVNTEGFEMTVAASQATKFPWGMYLPAIESIKK